LGIIILIAATAVAHDMYLMRPVGSIALTTDLKSTLEEV
jgi:hypothetical protein